MDGQGQCGVCGAERRGNRDHGPACLQRTLGFSGECSNKECDFLHLKTPSEAQDCPSYDQGFCKDGEPPQREQRGRGGQMGGLPAGRWHFGVRSTGGSELPTPSRRPFHGSQPAPRRPCHGDVRAGGLLGAGAGAAPMASGLVGCTTLNGFLTYGNRRRSILGWPGRSHGGAPGEPGL